MDGFDYRYGLEKSLDFAELYRINSVFEKKRLLDFLQNDNVPLVPKIGILDEKYYKREVRPYNMFEGGLMDQFDFSPLIDEV